MRPSRCSWLVLTWTLLAPSAHAQEEKVRTIPFAGPEIVCHVLHGLDLKPIHELDPEQLNPSQTVIIIFGQSPLLDRIDEATGGLARYLELGGSLLLATDERLDRPDLGIHIAGGRKTQSEKNAYRGNPQCPLLKYPWLESNAHFELEHPLFRFLGKGIASNRPSFVTWQQGILPLHSLLEFQSDRGAGRRVHPYSTYMLGSGKDAPPGRALFIAGQGMFMNGMMLQSDNDNFSFTVNAVEWLRAGADNSKRSRALFVVDGKIISDFNVNLRPPPPPIPIPTIKMLNRLLRGLEDERMFHRMLASLTDLDRAVALGLALGTFALLLYGVKKFMEGRFQQDTSVPLLVSAPPANGVAVPHMELRQHDLLRRNNFWEVAHSLAQEWIREQFGITPEQWAEGCAGELRITRRNSTLQRQVDFILRLLHAGKPVKITQREFLALVQSLPHLSGAVHEKRLALLVEGKKVRQVEE